MKKHLICYPSGAAGNFIACLLRILHDKSFYKKDMIPSDGCCDHIANAYYLLMTFRQQKISLYPENESTASKVVDLLTEQDKNLINCIHFIKANNINKFLTVPGLEVIYINHNVQDRPQIAINKIIKNFVVKDVNLGKTIIENAVKQFGHDTLKDVVDYLSEAETLKNMPAPLKQQMITAWCTELQQSYEEITSSHDRLLTLEFNDIMTNPRRVIDQLCQITNLDSSDELQDFYTEYLSKQPNIDYYLSDKI
jgi:hypothetical protein